MPKTTEQTSAEEKFGIAKETTWELTTKKQPNSNTFFINGTPVNGYATYKGFVPLIPPTATVSVP